MQAYVKEQQEGGGKWKKGSGNRKGAAAVQMPVQSEIGPLAWQGQFSPQPYWGWQVPAMQTAKFNYSSGYGQQGGGGGNQGRGDRNARFPCDQLGHWKYQPVCPNYHIHLETLQQAAAAYRSG